MEARLWDNGGRRSGVERRQFTYTVHVPERRAGEDRRCGNDRRNGTRLGPDHRRLPED